MARVVFARGGGAGGYVCVPRHLASRRAETERDVAAEGVSEEARDSSVFPEVRSAGGLKWRHCF